MITYTPQDIFSDTEIYDLTDLVKGGNDGTSNVPLKALLDRSLYLFNRLARFEDVKIITGNYAYDAADVRKQFVFFIGDNTTFTLPDVTTLKAGSLVPIRARISAIKALTVQCYGNQQILAGGIFGQDVSAMFIHHGESLVLEAAADHWEVFYADGNFFMGIGETFAGRVTGKNMMIAQGQLINRADMPRINEYCSYLTDNQTIVSDAIWLSDPNNYPVYRGCYSSGNGVTTLRIPDERGMFTRFMDNGRGIDLSRLHGYAGGYEYDQILKHDHVMHGKGPIPSINLYLTRIVQTNSQRYSGGGADILGGSPIPDTTMRTGDTGTSENTVKNIGKLPLIRY